MQIEDNAFYSFLPSDILAPPPPPQTENTFTQKFLTIAKCPGRNYTCSNEHKCRIAKYLEQCYSAREEREEKLKIINSLSTINLKECVSNLILSVNKDPKMNPVINFTIQAVREKKEYEALALIGKIIYLIDFCKDDLLLGDLDEHTINTLFTREINRSQERVKQLLDKYSESGIQDPSAILRTLIGREAASFLIAKKGFVNFALIPDIEAYFKSYDLEPSGYSQNFLSTLEAFKQDAKLREKLANFKRPQKTNKRGKNIIKASLGINAHFRSYHCKKTAFFACLSYPRQEQASNCFAISIAISFFSTNLSRCLDDFREILSHGYISRCIEGKKVYFLAYLKHEKERLTEAIFLKDPKNIIQLQNIKKLTGIAPLDKPASLKEIFSAYGKEASFAEFIFESETKNPLLSVWSSILASMSEGSSDAIIKTALINTISFAIKNKTVPFKENFIENLKKRARYVYDPSLSSDKKQGGFVLYDIYKKKFKKVNTPQRFIHFINSCSGSQLYQSPDELKPLLHAFQQRNITDDINEVAFEKRPFTLWITKMGNNPGNVLKNYHGLDTFTYSIVPKNAQDLLALVTKIALEHPSAVSTNRKARIPVRIKGLHSFNLILSHPTFMNHLINPHLLTTMKERIEKLANEPLSESLREKIEKQAANLHPEYKKTLSYHLIYPTIKKIALEIPASKSQNLVSLLDARQLQEIGKVAIHFADTNWQENGHDVHLAFAHNPFTMEIDVFLILDDNTIMKPNTIFKVKNTTWEFFKRCSLAA